MSKALLSARVATYLKKTVLTNMGKLSYKLNCLIVFFGSIPLRERVHGLHFRQFAPQFAYRSRPPPKGVAFLEATSLKKTVLTNMGQLSYKDNNFLKEERKG